MSDDHQSNQPQPDAQEAVKAPVQAELPIPQAGHMQYAPPAGGSNSQDAMKLAEIMAENATMKAKLEELVSAQGQEAQDRRDAEVKALAEKHRVQLEQATKQAQLAQQSAIRNAVKAHFKGSLKSEDYLSIVPAVQFNDLGDLTQESIDALDQFKQSKPELFSQPSSATTPISQSGANQGAHGFDSDTVAALRMNNIPLPGTQQHWQNRSNAGLMAQIVGHNSNAKPYGKVN